MNRLLQVADQQAIIVNAATYRDVDTFVWGLMQAEDRGKRFLFRTAASFVKSRGGVPDRGLLSSAELHSTAQKVGVGGLTIVGSYVQRTTEQLGEALRLDGVVGVELEVPRVLDAATRAREIKRVLASLEGELQEGTDVILFTSRELVVPDCMSQLWAAQLVSRSLSEVLCRLSVRPAYLVGKGGITSSDLATDGLGVRKAWVLGQIVPGVPVWRLGHESKYPGLPYVVFPGNVGGPEALGRAIQILRSDPLTNENECGII